MLNSIKTGICWRAVLVLNVLLISAGAQQQPEKGKSEWDGEPGSPGSGPVAPNQQCQPEKINQLFQEIIKCQAWKRPSGAPGYPQVGVPGGIPPISPRAYPAGSPSGGRGAEEFDFLSRGGPAFLSGGGQGGGVLVSRPIPADVRPVLGDGIPDGSQFFIAGPRMRPNAFPSYGGPGGSGGAGPKAGWPLIISSGPSGTPQNRPSGNGGEGGASPTDGEGGSGQGQTPEDIIRSIADSIGAQPGGGPGGIYNFRTTSYGDRNPFGGSPFGGSPFGGLPIGGLPFGGGPFGGGPSISTGPDGNTFELEFTSSGPGDINFNDILRVLKGLQPPSNDPNSNGAPGAPGAPSDPQSPDAAGAPGAPGAPSDPQSPDAAGTPGADGANEGSGADGAPASRSGEPNPDPTEGIIEVDTTAATSTDETATEATTNSPSEMP